jgi:hypothetical protein
MSDALLFPEEGHSTEGLLFEPTTNPVVVPKNAAELAAQLTLVDERDLEMPFTNRLAKKTQELNANGVSALLADVAKTERQDQQAALQAHAQDRAKQGDVPGLESASRMIAAARARLDAPTDVEGHKAVAQRALELMGVQYILNDYRSIEAFDETVSKASDKLALRNIVAHESAKLEGQTSWWDKTQLFFSQFIPFAHDYRVNRAISSVTGTDRYFDTEGAVNDFRAFFRGLGPQERVEVVKKLAEQQVGVFGENKAANVEMLRKLAELTKADANVDTVFNALGAFDVAALAKGLAYLVRAGTPLKVLNDTAGPKAAAGLAVTDLTSGSAVGGLNQADLMARFLSIGKNPMDVDPAAFSGMSAAGQAELRSAWNELLERTRDRLISSGLTPDELKEGLATIREKYSPETNKAIHSVIFGEGSERGQEMTVFWQGADGKAFASKEAAEAWAKAEGKVNYTVVPRNTTDTTVKMFDDDPLGYGADMTTGMKSGNVLYKSTPDEVAHIFESKQLWDDAGGDPMTEQLQQVWVSASKAGHTHASAKSLLDVIATQSIDEDMRFLANHLLKQTKAEWDRVRVELHYSLGARGGDYDLAHDFARVALHNADDPITIIHELMHAHSAQVITLVKGSPKLAAKHLTATQIGAAKEMIDLSKRLKGWFDKALYKERAKHGSLVDELGELSSNPRIAAMLDSPEELVAYGLTEPGLRDTLKKIKLSDLGYKSSESVWSKLWDGFKSILGLRANDTALAKLVQAQERLADTVTERSRKMLTGLHHAGALSEQEVGHLMKAPIGRKGDKKSVPIGKALEKEIAKEQDRILNGGLSPEEIGAAQERIKQLRELNNGGKKKAGAKTPPPASPREEWLVQENRADPISFANLGKFSDEDIRSMPWIAVDPKHAASELAVEERVIGVHAEAKTRKDLVKHMQPFFDKLSAKGKLRVKAVLEEGDSFSNVGGSTGKEFSYTELRTKGLSDDEAQAYFAARQVRMVSYHIRNDEMVRTLRAEGMKEVEIVATGAKYAGKPLAEAEAGQVLGKVVYDTVTGEAVLMDSAKLEAALKGGKTVVQMKAPIDMGGKHYSNILVDPSTAKAREIHTALHYRPGEFSRIYSDQYFIRVNKVKEVDGVHVEVPETVRTAASQREAVEYVAAYKTAVKMLLDAKTGGVPRNLDAELEKLVGKYGDVQQLKQSFANGELDGYVNMDWHYTRNKEEYLNGSVSEAIANGRLFTSKRSDRLFSVDRDRRNYLDVFESLEAEVTNISRVANISQWRESMIRKWMNTFGDLVPERTGNDVADFFSAAGAKFTKGTPEAQFAERTHAYIMRQIGVRTGEEKFYEGLTRMVTEKFFTGNEAIESVGAKIRTMSWLGFIRNVNFNLNLGMFNPAQLLVQANGAVTALALSPLHGLKAAYTFPLLRMALMSDNPEVWRNLARVEKLKNLGLSSEQEFFALVKAVKKSGILDNIRSTALWNLEDGALDIFAGYPKRAVGSHTFFFNRGEEFSRLVSFDVARREWMAKNAGDWTSDAALKQIVVRMDDLTQNMTKANLARFQEGVLSIPFQFAQYNIKLAANVMTAFVKGGQTRGFTRMEAAQLLAAHVALYGAAGNGLVALLDGVLPQETKDKMPVVLKNLLAQGLIAWAFDGVHQALTGEGAKVALGSRLGSFDYYQKVGEAIFKDPKNVYEALLGPTVSSAKRIGVIGEVAALWKKDPDLTGQEVLEGLATMGIEQAASLRNAAKAYLYMQHQGKMLDRQGLPMAQLNKNEMLWQALGFQPTAAVDLNNLIKNKQQHGEALDDIAKQVLRTQRDIITALKDGDEKKAAEKKKLLQALYPVNAGDFMEVQRRVRDKLFPYDNEMQKILGEYMWRGHTYDKPLIVTEEPKGKSNGQE